MNIINAHNHIIDTTKVFAEENINYLEYLKGIPTFAEVDEVAKMISKEHLLDQMEKAGVSRSVIFAVDAPILTAGNEFVSEICKAFPEKFYGYASVNPNRNNAVEKLQTAVERLGLIGLKLHPPLQNFYPNDRKVWPVYEMAAELGIPVVFHVGTTPFGNLVKLKQADPILIDEVANDFPQLRIVLTHLGTLWHNESFMIVEKHPNVYIDTAAYPYEISEILTEKTIMRIGEEKFIFGTDFPMPYEGKMHDLSDFVACINSLSISQELKERIFAQNFLEMMSHLLP